MPAALDVILATKITAALNEEVFSLAFEAESVYAPCWDERAELDELHVGVWPGSLAGESFERNRTFKTVQIGLTFARKVSAALKSEIDELLDLVSEIQEFLEFITVDLDDGNQFVNQEWEVPYRFDDTLLTRNKGADGIPRYTGLFASVMTFSFVLRE